MDGTAVSVAGTLERHAVVGDVPREFVVRMPQLPARFVWFVAGRRGAACCVGTISMARDAAAFLFSVSITVTLSRPVVACADRTDAKRGRAKRGRS